MNKIATIFGIIALLLGLTGFFPLLGWLNWAALFLSFWGMVFGLSARDKSTGTTINFLVMVLVLLRLFVNGGIV